MSTPNALHPASSSFEGYQQVRDAVLRQLEHAPREAFDERRLYELRMMDYLFDAGPAIVDRWREHCHHVSGVQSYAYRAHHAHRARDVARKFERQMKFDRRGVFVEEPEALGGFGFSMSDRRVNAETLRWNESLLALDEVGWLAELEALERPVVVELGGGWGGFGYTLRRRLPNLCHVIIDRPERLLFAGTYLRALFPEARCWIPTGVSADVSAPLAEFDVVLLPDYCWEPYVVRPDLGVSLFTFDPSSAGGHETFGPWLAARGCPRIYHALRETAAPKEVKRLQRSIEDRYAFRWSKQFRLADRTGQRRRVPNWARRLRDRLRGRPAAAPKRKPAFQHLFATLEAQDNARVAA